jgi:hypothetical protein
MYDFKDYSGDHTHLMSVSHIFDVLSDVASDILSVLTVVCTDILQCLLYLLPC